MLLNAGNLKHKPTPSSAPLRSKKGRFCSELVKTRLFSCDCEGYHSTIHPF